MEYASYEAITEFLVESSASKDVAKESLISLKSRYQEPWRHHHALKHPIELFNTVLPHIDSIKNPLTVGWAIMYHDAIYDPEAPPAKNEELSAQLAEHELLDIGGTHLAQSVARYTRATANHDTGHKDTDLDIFLDADLSVLGASPERYDSYVQDIRLEYAYLPQSIYTPGRIAVLENLATRVNKTGIFRTTIFKDLYEARAQENISREIDSLQA